MQSQTIRPSKAKYHSTLKMQALQYQGKDSVKVVEVPRPIITDSTDVIVKVTATTVCGSDLGLYHGSLSQLKKGDILGHECVGVVDEVGPDVIKFKKDDRVVISSIIACGQCSYCKHKDWCCCDATNLSETQEKLTGDTAVGFFGYGDAFGGYDGCQAEYVRVPFGDVNLFPIPDKITNKEAILVSDILGVALHGNVLANVKEGDRVVILGCGPVGLLTQMWAKYRGASMVVAIDVDQERLNFAKEQFGSTIINSKEEDALDAVRKLIPGGPDKIIESVGFRFSENFFDKLKKKFNLQSDVPNMINLALKMVKKNGVVTLLGDYSGSLGFVNHFNIEALMEKHLTLNGGQLSPHNYYQEIFEAMATGKIDPAVVFTHILPMSKLEQAYKMFDKHEHRMLKAFIVPDALYHHGSQ